MVRKLFFVFRMLGIVLIFYAALVLYFALKKENLIHHAEKEFELEQKEAEQKTEFNANCYLHKRYGILYPQFYIFSPCYPP